jgi:hypothetical protein
VGSTNRAGTVSTALELLRDLVETTGRRLQAHLVPLIESLQALILGRSASRSRLRRRHPPTRTRRRGRRCPPAVTGELPRAYGQAAPC